MDSDVAATLLTLRFAAGQVTQTVAVTLPSNDATAEGNEFVVSPARRRRG